jgi:hypothetical protein
MDHEGYYAEAFYPEPGQCFRMVSSSTQGSPVLCPKPVEFRGRFQDGRGKWYDVWSCIDHAGDLVKTASETATSEHPICLSRCR